jgi:drug/metabolite transporter (DMT)-like permease
MVSWLFVAVRIIANPLSNVFQKQLAQRSANPLFVIAATHTLLTLVCLPLLFAPLVLDTGWPFWANIIGAALLAVAGNALLVAALRSSDLSVLGPINAYKSVLGLILGIFLVHEVPTPMGALGVLLILGGSYFVIDRDENSPRRNAFVQFFRERGVRLRFASLAFSATEAIFLKKALLASSPLTAFVFWCILGLPIAALASTLLIRERLRDEFTILRQNKATYLRLAITTGLMQFALYL